MSATTLQKLEARPFVGIRRQLNVTQIVPFFTEAFPKVMGWLAAKGIEPASMPMAVWLKMDMETGIADCHAGCFVHEAVEGEGEITAGETTAGEALTVTHTGPYDTVGQTWMLLFQMAADMERRPGAGWEIYVDDPEQTPAAKVRTEIHLPLL